MDSVVRVSGMAVFRRRVAGRQDAEAVVPFTSLLEHSVVVVCDNAGGTSPLKAIKRRIYYMFCA
jgi:hypothetical protein